MPFFPDPNQQQQPFDWGSLASALIPAAAGLAFGGRRRGLYAAYGAAEGLAEQGRAKAEAEKEQRDWELKQERERREQEVANANIQHRQLQMQDLQTKSAQALKDQKSWEDFVSGLPETQQKEARAYPVAHRGDFLKAYNDHKLDTVDRQAIAKQLEASGFSKEDAAMMTAEGVPIQSVRQYPAKIMESKLKPGAGPWKHFDATTGDIITYDAKTGKAGKIHIEPPKPQKTGTTADLQSKMLTDWKKLNPKGTAEDWQKYITGPEGKLEYARRSGQISEGDYQASIGSMREQAAAKDAAEQKQAEDAVYRNWYNSYKWTTPTKQDWENYRTSAEGLQQIDNAKKQVQEDRAAGKIAPGGPPRLPQKGQAINMKDLPTPPKGKMLLRNNMTDPPTYGFADVGEVPQGFSRLK